MSRIAEHRDTPDTRDSLRQQLQQFPDELGALSRQPRDVPTRPGEARDKPELHRISCIYEDDRNRGGRMLCGEGSGRPPSCHENVNVEANKLGRERRQAISLPFRRSVFDDDAPTLDVAEVAEPFPKCIPGRHRCGSGRGRGPEKAYQRDPPCLLRVSEERRGEHCENEPRDESSLSHQTRSSSSHVPKSPQGRTSSIARRHRKGETSERSGLP